uniref:Uncharacterized protein n=1 Tax=Dicentrarchus labrax TaxID=13489 RepID=A0A8C4EF68_DICLA
AKIWLSCHFLSGGSIMIWGVFSFNGKMELQVVQGRKTAAVYVEIIQGSIQGSVWSSVQRMLMLMLHSIVNDNLTK